MAQKIFPRSLRSQKLLSQDFSFYAENNYSEVWAKSCQLSENLFLFSQKNLQYKNKNKAGGNKRPTKKRKLPSFLNSRLYVSNLMGTYKVSPILFKFAHQTFSKKYNPIKAVYKIRRTKRKDVKKRFL
jgi:hypothetical protein